MRKVIVIPMNRWLGLRGGSWFSFDAGVCRVVFRRNPAPDARYSFGGARMCFHLTPENGKRCTK